MRGHVLGQGSAVGTYAEGALKGTQSPLTSPISHTMSNESITKVSDSDNPEGKMGQRYLASGVHVSLRKWEDEEPGEPKEPSARDYETAGYVLKGRAELHIGDQIAVLEPGDSWDRQPGRDAHPTGFSRRSAPSRRPRRPPKRTVGTSRSARRHNRERVPRNPSP